MEEGALDIIVLLTTGTAAGFLAGLLGIGGGLVIVPAVSALLAWQGHGPDVAVPVAVATSLGSMLLTSAGSAAAHARAGDLDWSTALRIGPALAAGALGGAALAARLPGVALARVFAVVALLIGLRMLLGRTPSSSARAPSPRGWPVAAPLIGAVSAMAGIGGGSFNVPWLVRNGYTALQAVAIAAACGWPIALAGVAGFALLSESPPGVPGLAGHVHVAGALLVGLAGIASAPLGAAAARRIGSAGLARLFGAFLLLVAVRMALQ
ncbi:MAG: sulfite exporter TauE/SafE family protein [Wenzhouxiangellaceae bacterium]|nr:sulfite exporter TauE/SafE family protein [Wenzhouxiangellaceae bacterium]